VQAASIIALEANALSSSPRSASVYTCDTFTELVDEGGVHLLLREKIHMPPLKIGCSPLLVLDPLLFGKIAG